MAQLLPQAAWRPALQAGRITLRELLTHTHGIDADSVPAQLRVNFSGVYRNNAELLHWLAQATPSAEGKRFAYSNLGYDLAAIAMAPAGRDGWKTQVQHEVLDLLGLKHTSPWRSALEAKALAAPHADSPHGWRTLPANKQDSNMGPAGGLFATAGDLARLIQALLDAGRLEGRSVLTPAVLEPMLNALVLQNRQVLGYQRHGHNLGLDLARLHGQEILTRLGSFRGASSHFSCMPAQGLGVALLSNGDAVAGMAGEQLAQAIYRCLLGQPAAARQALADGLQRVLQLQSRLRAAPPPAPASEWPLPPEALVGRYHDEQIGDLDLAWTGQALLARWGVLQSELTLRFADKLQWRVDWSGQGVLVGFQADEEMQVNAPFRSACAQAIASFPGNRVELRSDQERELTRLARYKPSSARLAQRAECLAGRRRSADSMAAPGSNRGETGDSVSASMLREQEARWATRAADSRPAALQSNCVHRVEADHRR